MLFFWDFGFRYSDLFRISSFGFRISGQSPLPLNANRKPVLRCAVLAVLALVPLLTAVAQDEEKKGKEAVRFGFDANLTVYPQKMPKDTIGSVVKAIDNKRIDYLLAQLADPRFVDTQINEYRPLFPKAKDEAATFLAFDRLVAETVQHFQSDPILVKDLRRFARDAEWEVNDDVAVGALKDLAARKVFLKRIGERWFLENRQQ
jgi:hypothetical protein